MTNLLITGADIGRDPDTATALTYQKGDSRLNLIGITVAHMIPKKRAQIAKAMLHHLNQDNIPIGVGSKFVGKENEKDFSTYMKKHSALGFHYEGEGIDWYKFNIPDKNAEEVILESVYSYPENLYIAAIGPMTDLANAIIKERSLFKKVCGVNIMGQVKKYKDSLIPNPEAYNCMLDEEAVSTILSLKKDVPLTFVTKHAIKDLILQKTDFKMFLETNHLVGNYLYIHANYSLKCFAKRDPEIFRRVFDISESKDVIEAIPMLRGISKPYDVATVSSISYPEMYSPFEFEGVNIIGLNKEVSGVKSSEKTKNHLVNTVLKAFD